MLKVSFFNRLTLSPVNLIHNSILNLSAKCDNEAELGITNLVWISLLNFARVIR